MRITAKNLNEIVDHYRSRLLNKRITKIVLVNARLFLFYLKNDDEQLLVDLDNNHPRFGLLKTNYDELTLPSNFISAALSKGAPKIEKVETINNDKVIRITTSATDAYYHHHQYYLYIELINAHANMILTDEDNKIIAAFYETNINAPRLIMKNVKYQLPEKKNELNDSDTFSVEEYEKEIARSFNDGLNKRKKELFGPLIKKYEREIKNTTRKIGKIKESIKLAKEHLSYKDDGEFILMNVHEIKRGSSEYQGIKLDPSKDAITNANIYFNKYKKAKRTIELSENILKDAEKELNDATYYYDVLLMGKEEDIKLFTRKPQKKREEPAYLPYYIRHQGVTYYFGHNALENDYLTFKMFRKTSDVTWLHLKDQASAHIIINVGKPTNEMLNIASSLLLTISKMSSGEIMWTHRKNITRDNALAKANVLNYQSINLRQIDPIVIELLKKKKRAHE